MKPWKVIKDNPERVQTQMYVALQIAAFEFPFYRSLRIIPESKNRNSVEQGFQKHLILAANR
jgi:hypothetical protein